MDIQAVRQMVQKVIIEDLDIQQALLPQDTDVKENVVEGPGFAIVGEVSIVISKPKPNGTQRLSAKIFYDEDEFLIIGSIDPALEVVSLSLYKKTGSRILDME